MHPKPDHEYEAWGQLSMRLPSELWLDLAQPLFLCPVQQGLREEGPGRRLPHGGCPRLQLPLQKHGQPAKHKRSRCKTRNYSGPFQTDRNSLLFKQAESRKHVNLLEDCKSFRKSLLSEILHISHGACSVVFAFNCLAMPFDLKMSKPWILRRNFGS